MNFFLRIRYFVIYLFSFLFRDEHQQLKEIAKRKRQEENKKREENLATMFETLIPYLKFMEKNNLDSLTFPISDLSKFDYTLLSLVFVKYDFKIAYTRLEREDDIFTLTLYKNRPEAISRLYLAIVLRIVLWVVVAGMMVYPLYLVAHPSIELLTSHYSSPFILSILLNLLVGFFGISSSKVLSGVIFKQSKVAKEFQHTIRFDEVYYK